ncbi:MAG: TlpA family protein disulfide reductase [Myxococcales bacterium]|nr:TlpA family protein disulfide reductase [Myxococcales bacterium]MCB9748696.1 TlpA family protein disulfide reductase [Myxococcales bacterium]
MRGFLQRLGGALLDPRATLLELGPARRGAAANSDARARQGGRAATLLDGWILLLIYLLGARLIPIMDAVADAWAMHGLGSLQALLPLVFVILPWVLTGFALEILLGRALDDRDELLRAPLVVVALLTTALAGVTTIPGPSFAPDILGGALCLTLAWFVRDVVGVRDETPPPATPSSRPPALRSLARLAGLLLCLVFAVNLARQVHVVQRDWTQMAPVSRGEVMPSFELPTRAGGVLDDQALRGQVSVLVFWTTWCGNCDTEMPVLASLQERFAAHGVEVIAVNCDRGNQLVKIHEYGARRELPFTVALDDGRLQAALRVRVYPHIVLVDPAGTIRYVHQGTVREGTLASEIRTILRAGD